MSVRGVWEAAGGIHGPGRSRPLRGRARDPASARPGRLPTRLRRQENRRPQDTRAAACPTQGPPRELPSGAGRGVSTPVRPRPLCTRPRHRRRAAGSTGTGGDTEEPADAREPAPAFRPRQHRERQGGDGGRRVRLGQASARRCDADGVLVTTGRDAAWPVRAAASPAGLRVTDPEAASGPAEPSPRGSRSARFTLPPQPQAPSCPKGPPPAALLPRSAGSGWGV